MEAIELWSTTLVREPGPVLPRTKMTEAAHAAELMAHLFGDSPQEHLVVFVLDRAARIVGIHPCTSGTVDRTVVRPSEVYRPAVLANAVGIIVAHNHPTGDLELSKADRMTFMQLWSAGRMLDIQLVDFIVTNHRGEWVSASPDGPDEVLAALDC